MKGSSQSGRDLFWRLSPLGEPRPAAIYEGRASWGQGKKKGRRERSPLTTAPKRTCRNREEKKGVAETR